MSRQKQADDAIYDTLARQYEQFRQVDRTFELVAKAVSPAVVHIVAKKVTQGRGRPATAGLRGDRFGHHRPQRPGSRPLRLDQSSRGRRLQAGQDPRFLARRAERSYRSKVWNDAKADIAVLQLDRDDLPAARLGNSDEAQVGNWVMALGSPFGLMHSVSQGIISARGRQMDELPDVVNQDFLQTDAAINPGNSGGPLVNMKGEVIGINNSIASNGGGNEGVGFSIPINLARWIMNELITHGRVTRGALGVDLQQFEQKDAVALGMERPRGAWIGKVHRSSPADQAGLRDGDVVLRFSGIEIIDLNHLINMVSMSDRRRVRRGDHLARPPRAETHGHRRRPRTNAQPVDRLAGRGE